MLTKILCFLHFNICAVLTIVCTMLYLHSGTIFDSSNLLFCMGLLYTQGTLCIASVIPIRFIYKYPDLMETMHRSRYCLECILLPCILWSFAFYPHWRVPPGAPTMGLSFILVCIHLAASLPATRECVDYPFSPDLSSGVLYWKPARFSKILLYPTYATSFAVYAYGVSIFLQSPGYVWQKELRLVIIAAAFHFVNTRGRAQGRSFPGDLVLQQAVSIAIILYLLYDLNISFYCKLDDFSCALTTAKGRKLILNSDYMNRLGVLPAFILNWR